MSKHLSQFEYMNTVNAAIQKFAYVRDAVITSYTVTHEAIKIEFHEYIDWSSTQTIEFSSLKQLELYSERFHEWKNRTKS